MHRRQAHQISLRLMGTASLVSFCDNTVGVRFIKRSLVAHSGGEIGSFLLVDDEGDG